MNVKIVEDCIEFSFDDRKYYPMQMGDLFIFICSNHSLHNYFDLEIDSGKCLNKDIEKYLITHLKEYRIVLKSYRKFLFLI